MGSHLHIIIYYRLLMLLLHIIIIIIMILSSSSLTSSMAQKKSLFINKLQTTNSSSVLFATIIIVINIYRKKMDIGVIMSVMSLWIDAFCFYQLGIIYNVIEVAFRPGEHRFNLKCFCSNFVLPKSSHGR